MDFINFRVGAKTISLNILDILVTERFEDNLTQLPNHNASFIGVKDYMDVPTPVFDLSLILNNQSTQATNAALLEALNQQQHQHHVWLNQLEHAILDKTPFSGILSAEQSELGIWAKNFKTDNEDLAVILERIMPPLKQSFALANQALEEAKSGQDDAAKSTLAQLKRASHAILMRVFESAREQIQLDYKPIIVYTTQDGSKPHLGLLVDKVEDSVSVDEESIKPLDKLTSVGFDIDAQTRHMMTGLIKLPHCHSVIINPGAIFIDHSLEEALTDQEALEA